MANIGPRQTKKDKIARQGMDEFEVGVQFRRPRIKIWQVIEDMYSMKPRPTLFGHFDFQLPIMSGFIHTLKSKIDNPPVIKYTSDNEADLEKAEKVSALWLKESKHPTKLWSRVDRGVKHLCINSGVGFYAIGSERPYNSYFEWIDHYDFIQDPHGGAILENGNYCGRDGIIKSAWQIKQDVKLRNYDESQVKKLISPSSSSDKATEQAARISEEKKNRFTALDMDFQNQKFFLPSQKPFKLVEFVTTFKGERWIVVFNHELQIWVKVVPLKEEFESGLYPYERWAAFDDPINPWPLSPAEEMIAVTEAINLLLNQAFENRQMQNWNQRGYDPEMITDPSELEFIEQGLVEIKVPRGKRIEDGIFQFTTPTLSETIDLSSFLDSFVGKQTGVTAGTQGVSEKDKKVGIFKGELAQVADRFGLLNKEYAEAWAGLGLKYFHGVRENLTESISVRLIGEKGYENKDLTGGDLTQANKKGRPPAEIDFDVNIESSDADLEAEEFEKQAKILAIERGVARGVVSMKAATARELRDSGLEPDEVQELMDVQGDGNRKILAEAASENEELAKGKKVPPNRKATIGHIRGHMEFILDNIFSEDPKEDAKIVANIRQHLTSELPAAVRNGKRELERQLAQVGQVSESIGEGIRPKTAGAGGAKPPEETPESPPREGPEATATEIKKDL